MTKAEIIAELRRSAREDESPMAHMRYPAWDAQHDWRVRGEWYGPMSGWDQRVFLLIVAHALEDE